MSDSTASNPDAKSVPDAIATLRMRLNTLSSTELENSDGTGVVYQTIEVFPAADDVAIIRGTPHYFRDDHNIITLIPTEQRANVIFGSSALSKRDDPETYTIRAFADIPGLGRLSKQVTDTSSIADDYKRGDSLGGDYESLRSSFVSLV